MMRISKFLRKTTCFVSQNLSTFGKVCPRAAEMKIATTPGFCPLSERKRIESCAVFINSEGQCAENILSLKEAFVTLAGELHTVKQDLKLMNLAVLLGQVCTLYRECLGKFYLSVHKIKNADGASASWDDLIPPVPVSTYNSDEQEAYNEKLANYNTVMVEICKMETNLKPKLASEVAKFTQNVRVPLLHRPEIVGSLLEELKNFKYDEKTQVHEPLALGLIEVIETYKAHDRLPSRSHVNAYKKFAQAYVP